MTIEPSPRILAAGELASSYFTLSKSRPFISAVKVASYAFTLGILPLVSGIVYCVYYVHQKKCIKFLQQKASIDPQWVIDNIQRYRLASAKERGAIAGIVMRQLHTTVDKNWIQHFELSDTVRQAQLLKLISHTFDKEQLQKIISTIQFYDLCDQSRMKLYEYCFYVRMLPKGISREDQIKVWQHLTSVRPSNDLELNSIMANLAIQCIDEYQLDNLPSDVKIAGVLNMFNSQIFFPVNVKAAVHSLKLDVEACSTLALQMIKDWGRLDGSDFDRLKYCLSELTIYVLPYRLNVIVPEDLRRATIPQRVELTTALGR